MNVFRQGDFVHGPKTLTHKIEDRRHYGRRFFARDEDLSSAHINVDLAVHDHLLQDTEEPSGFAVWLVGNRGVSALDTRLIGLGNSSCNWIVAIVTAVTAHQGGDDPLNARLTEIINVIRRKQPQSDKEGDR